MPTRLAAPSHLLDAIFQQTNKLGWQDRQAIIRFLSGEDPHMLENRRRRSRSDASSSDNTNINQPPRNDRFFAAGDLDFPRSYNATMDSRQQRTQQQLPQHYGFEEGSNEDEPGRVNNRTGSSPTIRQILLHEERRTELRPVQQPSQSSSSRDRSSMEENSDGNSRRHPTDLGAFVATTGAISDPLAEQQTLMKPFTIIDQIIFEMDYRTGCWRKLRRRIRMADRRSNFNGDFISDDGRVLNANGDEIPSVYLSNNSSSNSRQSAESSSGVHGPARNYGNSTDVQNRSLRAFDNLFSRPAGGSLATENAETVAAAPSNGTTPPFRISRPVITSQPLSAIPTNTPLSIQRSSVRRNTVDNSRISGSQSASLNDFAVDRTSWLPWAGEPVMERRPAMAGGLAMAQADNTAATTDKPSYEQQQQPPAAGSRMNNHIGNAIGR